MTRKGKQNSASNRGGNARNNASGSGSRGGNGNRARGANSSHRGRVGRDRGNNNNDRRRDDVQRTTPTPLSVPEIKQAQQETSMANFSSSELSYNGSDRIISITNGEIIRTIWKKILRKENDWEQRDARIFISSALVATDHQSGYEVEEFVTDLGNPERGLNRLRDIINFPSMSCDAGLNPRIYSFQHVILPLLGLLTRTAITECILEKYVHAIYMVVYNSLDSFLVNNVMKMLDTLVQRNSFADYQVSADELLKRERYAFIPSSLGIFFLVIVRLLTEILRRIKEASINETMHKIADDLQKLKTQYQNSIQQQPFSTDSTDPLVKSLESRKYFFVILEKEMNNMYKLLNNGRIRLIDGQDPNKKGLVSRLTSINHYKDLSRKVDAERLYDPPGELSSSGKRHDNDFEEISKISVIPTKEEILCERMPFLPFTIHDAPHFLPDGMAKLLDIQFRLLREDMLNPIRGSISSLMALLAQNLNSSSNNNKFSKELKKLQHEYADLQVYTDIKLVDVSCDRRKGFACTIRFTPPRMRGAKTERNRREYWERSKKLLNGSLITLLLPNQYAKQQTNDNTSESISTNSTKMYSPYFGVVVSRNEKALAKNPNYADIDINFTDLSIYPIALNEMSNSAKVSTENRFMVESTGVYLEAYYHVLKTIQTTNPSSLPFEKYLTPNFDDINDGKGKGNNTAIDVEVEPPLYTRAPRFEFDLSVICKDKNQDLKLNVADKDKYDEIANKINERCKLDLTQAEALISALTREIALIEGPPGTGKTVVGIEIMKVLLAKENRKIKIGPILTICFTNHALDQFLEHLLDANITNIVRLGSRTKSDKIKEFCLEEVCRNRARNRTESRLIAQLHESLENIEDKVNRIKSTLFKKGLKWGDIREYMMLEERKFYDVFCKVKDSDLPSWVFNTEEGFMSDFKSARKNQKKLHLFDRWSKGEDIEIIRRTQKALLNPPPKNKKNKKDPNKNTYDALKIEDESEEETFSDDNKSQTDYETLQWIKDYVEPKTFRPLEALLSSSSVWQMSRVERRILTDYWCTKIRGELIEELSSLQKSHDDKRQEMNEIYDEGRRRILLASDVIGMTTNGAAKFQALIRSIGPRIIVCEEAGEVLEAHILSALTPSTQHIILIGDPHQLRPNIATYSLNMDSTLGKNYQLNKSLFERLVEGDNSAKIGKVQLLTQRRMRKEISDLVRRTLYPKLIDGENTAKYPNVRGAQYNVYFINHRHPEDSGGDFAMQSHVNKYEVEMVVEMVKYFIRNGYTKSEDIAVLTPYLGQMIKIRDALSKSFVVVIDERDAQKLEEIEEKEDGYDENDNREGKDNTIGSISVASKKSLQQQITLRTVDNFQGEEATIVIISLVRNYSGSGKRDTIGFLRSKNRSNVLLSRARQGMYLLGNSELMASESKDMWAPVIKILDERNQIGDGMPIVCNQHPDYKHVIDEAEQFIQVSPDGGCYEPCRSSLLCGHTCIYKCHSDNADHIGIKCPKNCTRLYQPCAHPCPKLCFEDCGKCEFSIGDIILPKCGHILVNAKCWQNQEKDTFQCLTMVEKQLIYCEHSKVVHCFESIDNAICYKKCGNMLGCNHECLTECYRCQKLSKPKDETQNESNEETNKIIRETHGECEPQNETNEETNKITRTIHGKCKHICKRLLFCGHICNQYCHEGKVCPPCNNKCTVSCMHASCSFGCLEPCAVCAEKCLWECEHQGRCELSCGAPCHRLPCNERCNKQLKCGHLCAGVCGEYCPPEYFCIICAHENVRSQVPDVIMNATFNEIDWDEERMIVLSCGHVFTMETMDMHMEMDKYYEGSVEEGWKSIKSLSSASLTDAKTCPTCRTPIKYIRRYGRIINKCVLDTQNKKFLTKYDSELQEITKQMILIEQQIKNKRIKLKNSLNKIPHYDPRPRDVVFKEINAINYELPEIIPCEYFENIETYHGFDNKCNRVWLAHVARLLKHYRILTTILCATKIPPHKKAFEAAVSSLYQAKLAREEAERDLISQLSNLNISDDLTNVYTPHESNSSPGKVLQETFSQIGISIPQVDHRIYLDALFELINIQKILFHEVSFIIQEVSKLLNVTNQEHVNINEVWKKFAERLQLSIKKHLNVIKEVAESTHYGRHLLLTNVEILELDLKIIQYQFRYPPNGSSIVDKTLRDNIIENCKKIVGGVSNILTSEGYKVAEETFKKGIHERLNNLLKSCNDVKTCAENLGKPLSDEETLEIHRAMKTEFKRSGHWFECPNGHPYTIGECSGAMEMSRCPDCNVAIGGGSHQLTTGNRVNEYFGKL